MTADHSIDAPLKKPHHSITPSRHANINWKLPDTPSDLIIKVGCVSFALHQGPLVSKCGLLRMLVAGGTKEDPFKVELDGVPGGAEGFELAAKFCYGMSPEISKHNVVLLRCIAEFLDMSEDKEQPSLVSQTEEYLDRVMTKHTFKDIVTVLHTCEALIPFSEDVGIVKRCTDSIVSMAMHDDRQQAEDSPHTLITFNEFQHNMNNNIEWWVEDLSMLGIHFYQKVLASMKKRGLRADAIGHALIYYAHKTLKSLTKKSLGPLDSASLKSKVKAHDASIAVEHEQRILVETIVSLLPRERNIASINFLIGMLRIARILETTLACRLDLEKRIACQLHRATLDDLLIPSYGKDTGDSLFDVETVHHLVVSFVEQQGDPDEFDNDDDMSDGYDDMQDGFNTTLVSQSPLIKVCKLVDGYLAEIASDSNLPLSKFVGLAELLPEYARSESDGLYRAIDIYMKTHGGMTDIERKKLCKLIDFQKLSPEACTHAAQNERLPVQAVVQVLYFEQMRIRNVMAGSHHPHVDEHPSPQAHHHQHHHSPHGRQHALYNDSHQHNHHSHHGRQHAHHHESHQNGHHHAHIHNAHQHGHHQEMSQDPFIHKISSGNLCAALSPHDQYASVRIENRELKQEVARMKMRLSDLEKGHYHTKQDMHDEAERAHHQPNHQNQQFGNHTQEHPHPHHHHGGFFHAFSKSLSKLNPFHHHKLAPAQTPQPPLATASKRRTKSVSSEHSKRESNKPVRRHSASH